MVNVYELGPEYSLAFDLDCALGRSSTSVSILLTDVGEVLMRCDTMRCGRVERPAEKSFGGNEIPLKAAVIGCSVRCYGYSLQGFTSARTLPWHPTGIARQSSYYIDQHVIHSLCLYLCIDERCPIRIVASSPLAKSLVLG